MKRLTSDAVNPILIKELRQGIRSKLFLSAFFAVQGLLFVYGMSLLMSDSLQREANVVTWLFWTALALPLLLQVPSMASQSIEKEIKGNTLELLLITRLSSMRLLIGKWLSVIVQATLLATTALPYVMLRYFLGGVDLWSELSAVVVLVSASAILAGMALGIGGVGRFAKGFVVLFVLILGPWAYVMFFASHGGIGAPGAGFGTMLLAYGFLGMSLMLLLGAQRIGPPAENQVTRLRIVALASLLDPICFRSAGTVATGLTVMILVCTSLAALSETLLPIPRLYAPFARTSGLKRLLLMPFAPGWPGGVAFTVLVSLLIPLLPVWIGAGDINPVVLLASLATLLLPAAILRGLVPKKLQSLRIYALLLLLSSVPLLVLLVATAFGNQWMVHAIKGLAGFMPPVALVLAFEPLSGFSMVLAFIQLVVVLVVCLCVLTSVGRREWAEVTRSVRSEPARPTAPAASPLVEGLSS